MRLAVLMRVRMLGTVSPPTVIGAARPELDPTVTTMEVRAGDRGEVAGYDDVLAGWGASAPHDGDVLQVGA